ncbi:hypothetical protein [Pampinifervens florentissimum]|uniref:hypothetical protein n=1 Tax=Pampinifervens florentissimum TaxID=1632019 RepID=UPI0013B47BC4|nr:hypothetical protein [Hydrogenobacter sp. T-8]QID33046.1 hypothetical protein G3M65_04400 [Hydrogenobacter sp. T-8]
MHRIRVNVYLHPIKHRETHRKAILLGKYAPDLLKTLLEIFLERVDEEDLLELLYIYDAYSGEKRKEKKRDFILSVLSLEHKDTEPEEEEEEEEEEVEERKASPLKKPKKRVEKKDDFWSKYSSILE